MNTDTNTKVFSRVLTIALVGGMFLICAATMFQGGGLVFADVGQ